MLGFLLNLLSSLKTLEKQKLEKVKKKLEKYKNTTTDDSDESNTNEDLDKVKKKLRKAKVKQVILAVAANVIGFFEMLPIFMTIFFVILAFLVLIVVVVIIICLMSFLTNFLNSGIVTNPDSTPQNTSYNGNNNWSLEVLETQGKALTNYEKNLYRLVYLSKKNIEGYGGTSLTWSDKEFADDIALRMILGIASTESGGVFYKNGNDTKNILVTPTDKNYTDADSFYTGCFGLHYTDKLSNYFPSDVLSNINNAYKADSTPSMFDILYVPRASAISAKHLHNKIAEQGVARDAHIVIIDTMMAKFGIVAKKDECKEFIIWALATSSYHGAQASETEYYVAFYCALWAASSPVDAERSISNWTSPATTYDEHSFRKLIIGSSAFYKLEDYATPLQLPKADSFILLNGVSLDVPLWTYMYQKYGSMPEMQAAWRYAKELAGLNDTGSGKAARVLNFHYGFNSYVQSEKIMKTLSSKLVVVENVVNIVAGDFKETPGVGQGNWGGKSAATLLTEYMSGNSSYRDSLIATFGTAKHLKSGTKIGNVVWQAGKYNVPFYAQMTSAPEAYGSIKWYPNAESSYTTSACMVFAHAYVASALTGRLINAAEMGAVMITQGALVESGISVYSIPKVYSKLGLKAELIPVISRDNWSAMWPKVDNCLKEGGLAVVRATNKPYATNGSDHFFVITDRLVGSDGTVSYGIYTSPSVSQTNARHSEATLKANLNRYISLVTK